MTSIAPSSTAERFREVLERLTMMSERDYYNPYQLFQWPPSLPEHQYWMSPELMSTYRTAVDEQLSEEQRWALSKWESINFYSLNVHGIRELLTEFIARIHTKGFELPSEYFHHLVGEENEHMWFFATFCLRYGHKIYPDKTLRLGSSDEQPAAANFLVFSRLLIFEEIVDFFNKQMGVDERLHPTIRQVNAIHHQDESRHIAFGRQIVALLHHELRRVLGPTELARLEDYLKHYIRAAVDSLCNPAVFKDAGVPEPYQVRTQVLADPAHRQLEERIVKRSVSFLCNEGILSDDRVLES